MITMIFYDILGVVIAKKTIIIGSTVSVPMGTQRVEVLSAP